MGNFELQPGDTLADEYEIISELGRGGMGVVYLAQNRQLKSLCAIKTFKNEFLVNPNVKESFKKEAMLWVQLERHPNILVARAVREISGRLFVSMDYVEPDEKGRITLLDHILGQNGPLLEQSALRWAIHFCAGMAHANAHGLRLHKDIKPTNILIGENSILKVADFGVAAVSTQIGESHQIPKTTPEIDITHFSRFVCRDKAITGTPGYIPPEEFMGKACDVRSDIYCFGLVLWQMATGSRAPPFTPTEYSSLEGYLQYTFNNQRLKLPDIPGCGYQPIIKKCLEFLPPDRYRDFAELEEALSETYSRIHSRGVVYRSRSPDTASDLANKATSLRALGKTKEAFELLTKALDIDPNCLSALNSMGILFARRNLFDKALFHFSKLVELDEKNPVAWANKGNVLNSLGRFEDAIVCHRKALQLDSKSSLAYAGLGSSFHSLKRYNEALEAIEKSLRVNHHSTNSWNNKGIILESMGRNNDAIQSFLHAHQIDNNCEEALVNLSRVYSKQEEYLDAFRCIVRLSKINPKNNYGMEEYARLVSILPVSQLRLVEPDVWDVTEKQLEPISKMLDDALEKAKKKKEMEKKGRFRKLFGRD